MAILRSRLNLLVDGSKDAIDTSLDETVAYVLLLIRIMCPVDTGRLRASYKESRESYKLRRIGTNVDYGKYQEFGTYKMSAQPHLLPAFIMARAYLIARLRANFARIL